MAIMDRRGDNRRGRFGSASEKSYYEMKKAAEERANRKKAKAKPKSKSNAELKKIADRDNKRGLTKKQARDIDLTGTRKRGSGAKAKTTTPKRKAGVGTIDGPRKTKTENKSILKQPQRMSTTPKTTTPKRKAGVGTIDGPRKTTTSNKSILKQPKRVSANSKKTSSFKEKVIQKANALKQRVIDKGNALKNIDTRQIQTGGARNRPGVTKLFDDGPSNKKDSFFPNSRSSRNREEGYNPDPFAEEYRKDGGEIKAYKNGGKVSSRGNGCAVRGIK